MTDAPLNCAAVLREISAYLDGELDAPECGRIDEHCRGCTDCEALVRGLRATIGLCRDAGATPLPSDVRERAQRSVRSLLQHKDR